MSKENPINNKPPLSFKGNQYPIEDLLNFQRNLSSKEGISNGMQEIIKTLEKYGNMTNNVMDQEFIPLRMAVKIFFEDMSIPMPEYKTKGASGMDLCAKLDEDVTINPLQRVLIPTGVYVEIPIGYEIQIRPRSGLSYKEGLTAILGTIDSDYRGQLFVNLANLSDQPKTVKRGDRIAQIVLQKVDFINWIPVDSKEDLIQTDRGNGGFGSTGK